MHDIKTFKIIDNNTKPTEQLCNFKQLILLLVKWVNNENEIQKQWFEQNPIHVIK